MEDEFDILTAKVLAGEATEQERSRLQSMLANSNELSAEFAALQSTWNSLKQTAPVLQAQAAPPVEIPAGRLRQLQQLLRDAHQVSPSAQTEKVRPHRQPERPAGPSMARIVRQWMRQWSGASQGMVSVGLILLVVGAFFWLNQPATKRSSVTISTAPVAHLLVLQGRPEVRRDDQVLFAAEAFTLRVGDEVHLPKGTEASVITPGGDVRLQGPKTSTASDLAASARSSNRRTNQMGQTSALHAALFQPMPELLKAGLLVTTRSVQGIALYSPASSTASLTPLILWKAEPGKTYDLRITDEFDAATPPWRLNAVTSPVEFGKVESWKGRTLAKDGLYRLRISEAGRSLSSCEHTFRTVPEERDSPPGATTNPLDEALKILTITPSRVGDALAILLALPPDLAGSELALRLKSLLFGQLGYADDFDAATARLTPLK